ncbi:Uncharacterised protein [Mycobacteroides abscessus]|nr:Uncharacterised protein [Mycobacteroides abscessus]
MCAMLIVIPRCFSSGAASISSKLRCVFAGRSGYVSASVFEIAAVSVVLPWST